MKRPWTSQPCSLSRRAATAESTPPERPTMMRWLMARPTSKAHRFCVECRAEVESRDRGERLAPAGHIVFDAAQYQRAAQLRLACLELAPRQPMRGNDAVIELLIAAVVGDCARERKALRGAAGARMAPEIDAHELIRREEPGGLLAHLTDDGLEQRLAGLDVSCRLVQDEAAVDALLDDEKAAVRFRD